ILAPSDLSNFLGCKQRSYLDRQVALGQLKRPGRTDPMLEALRERGLAHEQAYLEHLQSQGLKIVAAADLGEALIPGALGIDETLSAMRTVADVIYQGSLADNAWSGRPDFLIKVDIPSQLGNWSYEVADAKLARDTRAGTILQLCVYCQILTN